MVRSKTTRLAWLKWGVKQNMVNNGARGPGIVEECPFYPRSNGKPQKDWGREVESDNQMCVPK